jgi:hypothetical protein
MMDNIVVIVVREEVIARNVDANVSDRSSASRSRGKKAEALRQPPGRHWTAIRRHHA